MNTISLHDGSPINPGRVNFRFGMEIIRAGAEASINVIEKRRADAIRKRDALQSGTDFDQDEECIYWEDQVRIADEISKELCKNTALSAYHYWERWVTHAWDTASGSSTVSISGKAPKDHASYKKTARSLGYNLDPRLDWIWYLSNTIKHNKKDDHITDPEKMSGRCALFNHCPKMFNTFPDKPPSNADWAKYLCMKKIDMWLVLEIIDHSGPPLSLHREN